MNLKRCKIGKYYYYQYLESGYTVILKIIDRDGDELECEDFCLIDIADGDFIKGSRFHFDLEDGDEEYIVREVTPETNPEYFL